MQGNSLIKTFAILFGLVSIYQLSFTCISSTLENKAKNAAIEKISDFLPQLIGGSADLSGSNNTKTINSKISVSGIGLHSGKNVNLNMYPVNYGEIFPVSGGLPVSKRPPQRQKLRLQELNRWSSFLNIKLYFFYL